MGWVQRGAGVERLSHILVISGAVWAGGPRPGPARAPTISASTPYRAYRSSRPLSTASAPCRRGTSAGNA